MHSFSSLQHLAHKENATAMQDMLCEYSDTLDIMSTTKLFTCIPIFCSHMWVQSENCFMWAPQYSCYICMHVHGKTAVLLGMWVANDPCTVQRNETSSANFLVGSISLHVTNNCLHQILWPDATTLFDMWVYLHCLKCEYTYSVWHVSTPTVFDILVQPYPLTCE